MCFTRFEHVNFPINYYVGVYVIGTLFTSKSISGYNSVPPADDGSATEANRTTWAKHKTKLADPIKDLSEAINTALVAQVNEEVLDKGAAFTTTVAEHKKTINVTGAFTQSLGDATTMGTSYIVTIKNSHTAAITVDLDTAGDTLDGSAAGSTTLAPKQAKVFITNTAANGYYVLDADVFDAISVTGTTDSTSGSTGSINTAGGIGAVKDIVTDANLKVLGTTDSTSGSTGALQSAGGIGAVKDIVTDANFSDADGEIHPPLLKTEFDLTNGGANDLTLADYTSIPSWVKKITLMFNGVSTDGTSYLLIQLGDLGGIEPTGYLSDSTALLSSSVSTIGSNLGYLIKVGVAATSISGSMTINLENSGTHTWVASGIFNADTAGETYISSGVKSLTLALTQLRLTTTSGTDSFDAGAINVLYE